MSALEHPPPEPVYVLCCDDHIDDDTFDQHFQRDWEARRRRGERRGLVRYRPVQPSVLAAQAALATAARTGEVPDVVLIDNWLKARDGTREEGGFALLRHIVATFPPAQRPRCVLITGRFTPTVAHAFIVEGGTQAIDKLREGWDEWIAKIWKAVDGVRWRHEPDPPAVGFTPRDLELLPYLEEDRDIPATAAALGVDAEAVYDARRNLYRRLYKARAIEGALGGRTVALARAAVAAGAIWVPLAYREDAEAEPPARRSGRAEGRSSGHADASRR